MRSHHISLMDAVNQLRGRTPYDIRSRGLNSKYPMMKIAAGLFDADRALWKELAERCILSEHEYLKQFSHHQEK